MYTCEGQSGSIYFEFGILPLSEKWLLSFPFGPRGQGADVIEVAACFQSKVDAAFWSSANHIHERGVVVESCSEFHARL